MIKKKKTKKKKESVRKIKDNTPTYTVQIRALYQNIALSTYYSS